MRCGAYGSVKTVPTQCSWLLAKGSDRISEIYYSFVQVYYDRAVSVLLGGHSLVFWATFVFGEP